MRKVDNETWAEAEKWYRGEGCERLTQMQIAERLGVKQATVSRKLGKRRVKQETQTIQ